jgi:pilus assembly protein CpaE
MSTTPAALRPDPAPIVACTISRDVQNFDLLIEDMEAECGEAWGDLSFADAKVFLTQPEAQHVKFVAVAIDNEDEENLAVVADLIRTAIKHKIRVIVIAEEVSPIALHQLLKLGAEEFVPYPLPDGALHDAIERLNRPEAPATAAPADGTAKPKVTGDREGVILPVQSLAGGAGGSTFAVNLAWELANIDKKAPPRVLLIDLDLQHGSISTYLDLPRREAVYELLQDTAHMDQESFMQALLPFNDRLHVLTSPADLLPLDIITPADVTKILEAARTNFDYVVVDMPKTFVQWTETVLHEAHVYFALLEQDMRSAQNALRVLRALKGEELPFEKLRFLLNRAPGTLDLSGKSRVKRMAESLDITIEVQLPDGGKAVTQAGDHGLPLAESAAKNPLRREIQKLAKSVHDVNQSVAKAA